MNENDKQNEEILCHLGKLIHAARNVEARLEAALSAIGLNLSKYAVLDQLMKVGGPIPLTRLAERLSCVKSNITQLVDRLETDGLVARVDDPDDRRSVLAIIKDEGRRRYKMGSKALIEAENELQKPFSKNELALLTNLLGKFKD